MPEGRFSGRLLKVKKAGVVIAGLRTKSVTVGNDTIDVTTDDDTGIRRLLTNATDTNLEVAQKQIDISFDGIAQDDDLIKTAAEGTGLVDEYTLELPSGATIVGLFGFPSMEITGAYQDAVTFSGELQSTGPWVYTDAV